MMKNRLSCFDLNHQHNIEINERGVFHFFNNLLLSSDIHCLKRTNSL